MLEALLKLIEQLIRLVQQKEQTDRRWFDDVVEPLFKRMEPVAADYIAFFREAAGLAQQAVADPSREREIFAAAIEKLEGKRAETLQARRLVERLATEAKKAAPRDIATFCEHVEGFFYGTGFWVLGSHSMNMLDTFRAVAERRIPGDGEWWRSELGQYGKPKPLQSRHLVILCGGAERNLGREWVKICDDYARQRLALPK